MEDFELDRIIQASVTNFFSFGKRDKRIKLIGFDKNKEEHMALFSIALIVQRTFQYKLCVGCGGFFKFRKLKKEFKDRVEIFRLKDYDVFEMPSCDDFVRFVETAFNAPGAFREIYERYYREK